MKTTLLAILLPSLTFAAKETIFPEPISGDDFDGTPHLIVFSPIGQREIRKLTQTDQYGLGTPANPLKTLAKVYFDKSGKDPTFSFTCERTSPEFAIFPNKPNEAKKRYQTAVNAGCMFWKVKNTYSHQELLSYIHQDSHLLRPPYSEFETEEKFNDLIKKPHLAPPGKVKILCEYRINTPNDALLIQNAQVTKPDNTTLDYATLLIYNKKTNRWQFHGTNAPYGTGNIGFFAIENEESLLNHDRKLGINPYEKP